MKTSGCVGMRMQGVEGACTKEGQKLTGNSPNCIFLSRGWEAGDEGRLGIDLTHIT